MVARLPLFLYEVMDQVRQYKGKLYRRWGLASCFIGNLASFLVEHLLPLISSSCFYTTRNYPTSSFIHHHD